MLDLLQLREFCLSGLSYQLTNGQLLNTLSTLIQLTLVLLLRLRISRLLSQPLVQFQAILLIGKQSLSILLSLIS